MPSPWPLCAGLFRILMALLCGWIGVLPPNRGPHLLSRRLGLVVATINDAHRDTVVARPLDRDGAQLDPHEYHRHAPRPRQLCSGPSKRPIHRPRGLGRQLGRPRWGSSCFSRER
jgi:hypothetical protein